MSITIPYGNFTLSMALLGLQNRPGLKEKMEQMMGKYAQEDGAIPGGQAEVNRKVAEHNGITVETLINSPNFELLKEEYGNLMVSARVERMTKDLGLTNKEAWAIMAMALGLL